MKHSQGHTSQGNHPLKDAAIYAGVSTGDQGKGLMIPTQLEACQQLAGIGVERAVRRARGADPLPLTEQAHRAFTDRNALRLVQIRRQLSRGPVGPIQATAMAHI